MSHEPFDLQQALALCDTYKDLKGTLRLGIRGDFEVIEEIAIAPYGEINRQIFFVLYQELHCPLRAIEFYNKPEYTVVVILREVIPVGDGYLTYLDVWNYLEETGSSINVGLMEGT
jgi:hypothetical protein